jgi:hypothetical protein
MQRWVVFMVALAIIPAVEASVVLQEVLYDAAAESGGEAVYLKNTGMDAVDISGWMIATETSEKDATIPSGTVLGPGKGFLIADTGWESRKGELPSADYEESMTLTNTDAGVALKNGAGVIVDALGWGDASGIKVGLFEGTPHTGTTEGKVLRRLNDTDDNDADFVEDVPSLSAMLEIPVDIGVGGGVTIMMPSSIMLTPGTATTILLNGSFEADTVRLNETDFELSGKTFELPFTQAPGNYTASVWKDGVPVGSTTSVILPLEAIALDVDSFGFTDTAPGKKITVVGDEVFGSSEPTIRNAGNVPLTVLLAVRDLDATWNSTKLVTTAKPAMFLLPGESAPFSIEFTAPISPGKHEGALKIGTKHS